MTNKADHYGQIWESMGSFLEDGGIPRDVFERVMTDINSYKERVASARNLRLSTASHNNSFRLFWDVHALLYSLLVQFVDVWGDRIAYGNQRSASSAAGGEIGDDLMLALSLSHIYAAGVNVIEEIGELLQLGLARSASARLRTLHECLVIGSIISSDHTGLTAARFHDHAAVGSYHYLQDRLNNKLGWGLPPEQDQISLTSIYNGVLEKWGSKFVDDYEWARPALRNPPNRITFSVLEREAGLSDRRITYRLFSDAVHLTAFSIVDHPGGSAVVSELPGSRRDQLGEIPFVGATCMRYASELGLFLGYNAVLLYDREDIGKYASAIEAISVFAMSEFYPDDKKSSDS